MPHYSEDRDVLAEVQAMAVDLVDRLGPILNDLAQHPQPGAWSQLARATRHLQDFYERSFVELAEHPEPGRSQELADQIGPLLDGVSHREKSHEGQDRPLGYEEKAAIAEHATTAAGHLSLCLGALGDATFDGARPSSSQPMSPETVDAALRDALEYVQGVYQRLATATLNIQS